MNYFTYDMDRGEDSSATMVRALQPRVGRYLRARKQQVQSETSCKLLEAGTGKVTQTKI